MLEVRLLGQFEVRLDGALVTIPSRPAQSLFAYLVLNAGARHPRERLAGLLWPDLPDESARHNLRQALWHLRRAIAGNYFQADDLSVAFHPQPGCWLDVAVLDHPLENASADPAATDHLLQAVSVYRGELLPGFYQDWVTGERERLRSVFEQKINALLNRLMAAGRWAEVLQWSEQWIALARSPEPAFRALMTAHHQLGDQASAAAAFQRCVQALRADLGVEPSEQTRALFERLTRETAPPADQPTPPSFTERYRFEAEIGRGGMSVVYRAHDTLLNRPVAVKVLAAGGVGTEGRERWLREAQAAARLAHPNIVPVYDVGEADLLQHGGRVACIVMELVEGGSLHQRRPQSLAEVVRIARQLCAALENAHRHGIIHRDLKPENVLLAADGAAKLMDFGLARTPASRLTSEGAIVGTPFYLAPELLLGQSPSPQSDLYALGVMLYELTTGRLPFTSDDPLAVIAQHLHTPVVPPREVNPAIPPALSALIARLMSKAPADRPASAAEVRGALDEWERAVQPPRRPPSNLPAPPTPFVGRERELAEVAARLDNPECRLLTLTGPGGIGKTRLALQAAAAQVPNFPDGVFFVPLVSVSAADYLLSALAEALKFSFYGGEDPRAQLLNYLSDKRMLLVMDNFEHLLAGVGLLAEILATAPDVKCLVTSQERLNLRGEWLSEVHGMRIPPGDAEDAETFGAVKLFLQSARRADADFRLSEQDKPAVIRICQLVGGTPLGIELAAAWVRTLSCAEIAAEIERNLNFLSTTLRDVPERHRSLQAVFDHSWRRLADGERMVFSQLSVFWGGFQREAAEQVAGAALPLLSALVDKSLLRRTASGRYEMHELLRKYAHAQLREAGEAEAVWARHLDYFLRLVEAAAPGLRRAEQLDWLARLDTEYDNLRAAMKYALKTGALEAGLRLAGGLARFWYLRGYWDEGRDWLNKLLAQSAQTAEQSAGAKQARATALYGAAWLANEGKEEVPLYTEALALAREAEDKWGIAFCLRGLATRLSYQGEYSPAVEYLDESLRLFQELGDTWGVALVLFSQGWPPHDRGDYEQARELWEEGLKLFRETGDRWGVAVTLGSLGFLARLENDYTRSAQLSEASLSVFRELGDKAGIATSLSRLGTIAFRRGDFAQAAKLFDESQALAHELGSQWGVITAFGSLGLVACMQGDFERAQKALDESLEHAEAIGERSDYAFLLDHLALLAHYRGENARARTLWEEALAAHRENEDKDRLAFTLYGLGLAAHVRGDYPRARELFEESLVIGRELKDKRRVAIGLTGLGRVARAEGDLARAADLFKESLLMQKEVGNKHGLAEALEGLAGTAAARAEAPRAARLFGHAQAIREAIGAPLPPVERPEYERGVALARAALDEAAFNAAWAAGREMSLKQVLAEVSAAF